MLGQLGVFQSQHQCNIAPGPTILSCCSNCACAQVLCIFTRLLNGGSFLLSRKSKASPPITMPIGCNSAAQHMMRAVRELPPARHVPPLGQ
eukprot:5759149-Amphidinium_carterae.1